MACPTTVHETVCVDAEVTITPLVTVGEIHTNCIGDAVLGSCPGTPSQFCTFNIRQEICVEVPLTFEANASATPRGIVCSTPNIGSCSSTISCTYTIGYFKNHPDYITTLIVKAGGNIDLGNSSTGLGYTVTTAAEAVAVLSFNIPSSSLPTTATYAVQYSVLYAQLLAAKLNVLNGANCDAATAAISDADNFLASSPATGVAGAPALQEELALFNEGNAFGCPEHCS
jgi:hypothetical protein